MCSSEMLCAAMHCLLNTCCGAGMLHGLSSMTALGNTMAVLSHFVWLAVLVQGSLT